MKALERFTYLDNKTNKLVVKEGIIDLNCIDKNNCIKVYKINKHPSPNFVKGEIFYDLKKNQITFSRVSKNPYDKQEHVFTSVLDKCGKCWRGPNIYTEGLKGETSILEFRFL